MTDRPSSPMNLPKKPRLINRLVEVDEVAALRATALAEGEPLLVLLTGPQGIGKTVLAVSLGYRLAGDFPDGVLYCEARGSDLRDAASADELARRLLVLLGIPWTEVPAAAVDRIQALRTAMSGKRLLFIFDDVAVAAQIEPLLGDVSRAAVIVTSRNRLKSLEINHQFVQVRLPAFDQAASLQLMDSIAGDAVRGVPESVLARMCSICGGLPLALAVTAGRLVDGDETLADVVDQLTRNAMEALDINGDFVVKGVFDQVYRELRSDDRRAYRQLSLLPGPHFGPAAAAAVLDIPEHAAKRLLARFVSSNVLEDAGAARYRYHFLMREHALGIARDAGVEGVEDNGDADEEIAAVTKADRWYIRRAAALDRSFAARPVPQGSAELYATVDPAFSGAGQAASAATEFDVEWPNLLAATRRCADYGDYSSATIMATALCSYAYQSGRCTEVIDVYRRVLDLVTAEPVRWQVYRDLAQLHERLGEYEQVEQYASLAEEIHPPGRASAIEWRALSYESRGLLAEAQEAFRVAADAVPLMGDPAQQERASALLLMHRGRAGVKRGVFDDALPLVSAALRFFGRSGRDGSNVARCEALVGDVAWARDDFAEAEQRWTNAADTFAAHHVRADAVKTYDKLAALAEKLNRQADAAAYGAKAREIENGGGV
ncbi:NB-ARC domain-containing protein [Amycolatopsis sp. cmx-11-51]|uniref:NB-ARC domain-containing protein n=1 Tax=unclassified Amycolatopsis TaxID=2618356 RepID=UPI0039E24C4D